MKLLIPVVLILAVGAIAVAGTQGSSMSPNTTAPVPPSRRPAVAVRSTSLGDVLVDADGRTLYLFEADKPDKSNCSSACLSIWPPVTAAAKPMAGTGALPGKIGTIPAGGGKRQVTYKHHPLYLYAGDQKPGDTTGQGLKQFGAEWYVLAPTGEKIDNG
jgi:predicted lipoprotein with Yx(FWY)xxD motif